MTRAKLKTGEIIEKPLEEMLEFNDCTIKI